MWKFCKSSELCHNKLTEIRSRFQCSLSSLDNTILSTRLCCNGEWIAVRWDFLREACLNGAEKFKVCHCGLCDHCSLLQGQMDKDRKPEMLWGVGQGQTWWDFRNLWGWWWMSEIGLSAYWKAICFHYLPVLAYVYGEERGWVAEAYALG